jgi:hypothetical protein
MTSESEKGLAGEGSGGAGRFSFACPQRFIDFLQGAQY